VASPDNAGSTLYDDWLKESSKIYANGVKKPKIGDLGSGSDFTAFLQLCGISSTSMAYVSGFIMVEIVEYYIGFNVLSAIYCCLRVCSVN